MDTVETKRTIEDVKKEYRTICGQAGQLQYQIEVQKYELDQINQQMKALNIEAIELESKTNAQN
jgi:hypothetical protein